MRYLLLIAGSLALADVARADEEFTVRGTSAIAPPKAPGASKALPHSPRGEPVDARDAEISAMEEMAEDSTTDAPANGSGFLLLKNDRVVAGKVTKTATGWTVSKRGGSLVFPKDQVEAIGDSIRELYDHKFKFIPQHDISEHLKLYRWCTIHRLSAEAEAQLAHVLSLDPENAIADRYMRAQQRRRETEAQPASPPKAPPRTATVAPGDVIDNFIRGHGQQTFDRYVELERVLINRCGTAACHGNPRHAGDFLLYRKNTRDHNDVRLSARNLSTTLRQLDLQTPQRSSILSMAIEPHGGQSIASMGGVNDQDYKALRDWVFTVSQKWGVDDEALAHRPMNNDSVATPEFQRPRESFAVERQFTPKPKYLRPERSTAKGARGPSNLPIGAMGDDAPAPPAERIGRAPIRPPAATIKDPFDPSGFNADAPLPDVSADANEDEPVAKPTRGAAKNRPRPRPSADLLPPQLEVGVDPEVKGQSMPSGPDDFGGVRRTNAAAPPATLPPGVQGAVPSDLPSRLNSPQETFGSGRPAAGVPSQPMEAPGMKGQPFTPAPTPWQWLQSKVRRPPRAEIAPARIQ